MLQLLINIDNNTYCTYFCTILNIFNRIEKIIVLQLIPQVYIWVTVNDYPI